MKFLLSQLTIVAWKSEKILKGNTQTIFLCLVTCFHHSIILQYTYIIVRLKSTELDTHDSIPDNPIQTNSRS